MYISFKNIIPTCIIEEGKDEEHKQEQHNWSTPLALLDSPQISSKVATI